jgi:tetratricopeptide (TPR) repeat protein
VDIILKAIDTLEEKLLSGFYKLVDRETEKNKPTIELKIKVKQIKILSITASPEGENYILYEQEQDTLLEIFKFFDREQVFLDMPDPVKSTLVEIREHLEVGHHDILHITAHGGINEKGKGVLSLEDHQVLRDIFKSIDNKQGAVVLKGTGGIGKSTLTTRTAANLGRKGYDFIVVRGETTIEQILETISKKAAAMGVKDAEKVYAAKYFEAIRDEEGKIFLDDLIEARWHYLQAGQWNKAAEITFDLEDYLSLRGYPQWAMELLGELELTKLKEENWAEVHHRMGILYGEFFGEYEKALSHYNQALEINEKIDNIKGVSSSLHNIGAIYGLSSLRSQLE